MREISIDDSAWSRFVDGHPESLPFHHPRWTMLLAECYGLRPFALAVSDGDGRIVAGMPVLEVARLGRRRWVSQPFTDFSPPLVGAEHGPAFLESLEAARVDAAVDVELRGSVPGVESTGHPAAVTHVLPLAAGPESIWQGMRPNVRRNVRTAERAHVVVRQAESERDLTETFFQLQLRTRRRLGVPVQPRRWYRLLWRRLVEPGLGYVTLAYLESRAVAGAVFLAANGTVIYKYGASDHRAWGARPNNALYWEAIHGACAAGATSFHFGRTALSDESLRRFKCSWGSVEEPLAHVYLGAQPRTRGSARFARAMIRRSPAFVARAAGELFYRYAA